ncbi:ADP-ribosylglycohydrolase family protein [Streptomyces caniscabiei]|uniref:ADP-ribosylglycohydrolase family protein n=2 Tax=Streptomyces caniscabiei TaxID=2746961 RepID=UPI000A3AA4DA|nr:ADP-ribosylglycohydrolase family protein [Streptomyces caniscabiei]
MIQWVSLGSGPRPVPQPVATPLVWATAFGGAMALVAVLNALVGTDRPGLALVALSLLSALLGVYARFIAAPGTAALCWLFLNGFAIPPAGVLTWANPRDTFWLVCLLTAALTHADGDYTASICRAVSGGWDTDSNGATAGSIAGLLAGSPDALPDRWTAPLKNRLATSIADFNGIGFDTLAHLTLRETHRP